MENTFVKMKGKNTKHTYGRLLINSLFCSILFPLERNLMTIIVLSVITKKFPLTKTYIGNYVGILGALSLGYMYIVLILIPVQCFC